MATTATAEEKIVRISLDKIDASPFNPRKTFPEKSLQELADSITQKGIAQPLVVRPKGKRFELIFGERRSRAAAIAKQKDVPAIIRDLPDDEVRELQLVENIQREDLHPIEEAEVYEEILKHPDYTLEKLATKTGKKISYVRQRVQLLQLITPLRKAFVSGEIGWEQALQMCRVPQETQAHMLKYWRGDIPKASDIADVIAREIFLDLSKASFPLDDASLVPEAGACITCKKHTGADAALFDDVKKGDFCLDGACFQKKNGALIKITLATAKKEEKPLVPISTAQFFLSDQDLNKLPKGTLSRADNFHTVKKGDCEHAEEALVVHGDNLGKRVWICKTKSCPEHGDRHRSGYQGTGESDRERASRLARERAEKMGKETRRLIVRRISDEVTKLDREDLELLAVSTFDRLWGDMKKKFLSVAGWMRERKPKEDWSDLLTEQLKKQGDSGIQKTLMLLALAHHMEGSAYGEEAKEGKDVLHTFAKKYGVNVKEIEAQVKEKYTPKDKKESTEKPEAKKKKKK